MIKNQNAIERCGQLINELNARVRAQTSRESSVFLDPIQRNALKYVVTVHPDYYPYSIDGWDNLDEAGKKAAIKQTCDEIDSWLVNHCGRNIEFFTKLPKSWPFVKIDPIQQIHFYP